MHSMPEMCPSYDIGQKRTETTLIATIPLPFTDRFLTAVTTSWSPYWLRSITPFWILMAQDDSAYASIIRVETQISTDADGPITLKTSPPEPLGISPKIPRFPVAGWTVSGQLSVLWAMDGAIRLQILHPSWSIGSNQPNLEPDGRLLGSIPEQLSRPGQLRPYMSPWTESVMFVTASQASQVAVWEFC